MSTGLVETDDPTDAEDVEESAAAMFPDASCSSLRVELPSLFGQGLTGD